MSLKPAQPVSKTKGAKGMCMAHRAGPRPSSANRGRSWGRARWPAWRGPGQGTAEPRGAISTTTTKAPTQDWMRRRGVGGGQAGGPGSPLRGRGKGPGTPSDGPRRGLQSFAPRLGVREGFSFADFPRILFKSIVSSYQHLRKLAKLVQFSKTI